MVSHGVKWKLLPIVYNFSEVKVVVPEEEVRNTDLPAAVTSNKEEGDTNPLMVEAGIDLPAEMHPHPWTTLPTISKTIYHFKKRSLGCLTTKIKI